MRCWMCESQEVPVILEGVHPSQYGNPNLQRRYIPVEDGLCNACYKGTERIDYPPLCRWAAKNLHRFFEGRMYPEFICWEDLQAISEADSLEEKKRLA